MAGDGSRSAYSILVVGAMGQPRQIHLRMPVQVRVVGDGLVIRDAAGVDHFFLSDGRYDGWGVEMPDGADISDPSQAAAYAVTLMESIEREARGEPGDAS